MDFSVSVIVPVYNGGDKFKVCIDSLTKCVPPPEEIIVVADGVSDGAYLYAHEHGLKTIILEDKDGKPNGASVARNAGASAACGNILLFIDADVAVGKDIVVKIIDAFIENKDLDALIGSYNEEPKEKGVISQYRNLLHYYIHQISNERASTFWGACGAIRSEVFYSSGGFSTDYTVPSIEDIEFGYRLVSKRKQIKLKKDIQVTHLKKWGLWSVTTTDVIRRAIPWSKLILQRDGIPYDLNISLSARISTLAALVLAVSPLFHLLIGFPYYLHLVLFCSTVLILLNKGFYQFLLQKKGIVFLLSAIALHWLYFLYSGLSFIYTFIQLKIIEPGVQIFSTAKSHKPNK